MTMVFNRWLAALAACAGFCALSMLYLDRPVVRFLTSHIDDRTVLIRLLDVIVVPVPVCAAAVVWCGIAALRGRSVSRLVQTLSLAGFSVTWAVAVNDLMLKPLFGRWNIDDYFLHRYGFVPFAGSIQSSFPSGHAAILASLLSVFWLRYPRGRTVYAGIAVLLLSDLMMAGWHFLSDVAAGAFVGATAGLMTVALWRGRGLDHGTSNV